MSGIVSLFRSLWDTPEIRALAQEFPDIDVRSLREAPRVRLESDIRDEVGPEVYNEFLRDTWARTWVNYAGDDWLFYRRMGRELGHAPPEGLTLKQRALLLAYAANQRNFWEQAAVQHPQILPGIRVVAAAAFSRFSDGVAVPTQRDWDDMGIVAYSDVSPAFMNGWRRVDFLDRERILATRMCHEAVPAFEEEIERQKARLRDGERQQTDLLGSLASARAFETGAKRRQYNLVEGAKRMAEVARLFTAWSGSVDRFIRETGRDPQTRNDFDWFRTELDNIRHRLRVFNAGFPQPLLELERMSPDAIRARYPDQSDLERIVEQGLDQLNRRFYREFPNTFGRLEDAYKAPQTAQLLARNNKKAEICNAFQAALPPVFQVPSRVELCMKEIEEAMSLPSPLRLKILRTYETAKQVALTAEARR